MTHPTAGELEAYVTGEGDPAPVEAHLDGCADCLAVVAREARLELLLGEVGRELASCPGCAAELGGTRCDGCGAVREAGGFLVRELLVHNGHGRLYRAIGPDGAEVALKELAFVKPPGPDLVRAFEREAEFLRSLDHPCIPRFVASFGEGQGVHTRLYLAQQFIAGESLEAALATHRFSEPELRDLARRVLEILVYLQALTPMVFHRDIKPANILRRPDGSLALVDFGAAHTVGETVGSTVIGTFGYMPVEQLGGIVDRTTDLYALGATLFHLATRIEPWKILDGAPLAAANLSSGFTAFIERLLAREPKDRFPSAEEALAALDRPVIPLRPRRRSPLRPALLAAAATLALVASGGVAFIAVRGGAVALIAEKPVPAISLPPKARPDWITQEPSPGSARCAWTSAGLSCVGTSTYRSSQEQARAEAREAAIEALLFTALGEPDVPAGLAQSIVSTRSTILLGSLRYVMPSASLPQDIAHDMIRSRRAAVHAIVRAQSPPGIPSAETDSFWEEYSKPDGPGSEVLAFVRVDVREEQVKELRRHYQAVTEIAGAAVVPVTPLVGWLFDLEGKDGYIVIQSRGRPRVPVQRGDLLLVKHGDAIDRTDEIVLRRGPAFELVLRFSPEADGKGTRVKCDPHDPLCGAL